jgi:hypothetical protein
MPNHLERLGAAVCVSRASRDPRGPRGGPGSEQAADSARRGTYAVGQVVTTTFTYTSLPGRARRSPRPRTGARMCADRRSRPASAAQTARAARARLLQGLKRRLRATRQAQHDQRRAPHLHGDGDLDRRAAHNHDDQIRGYQGRSARSPGPKRLASASRVRTMPARPSRRRSSGNHSGGATRAGSQAGPGFGIAASPCATLVSQRCASAGRGIAERPRRDNHPQRRRGWDNHPHAGRGTGLG